MRVCGYCDHEADQHESKDYLYDRRETRGGCMVPGCPCAIFIKIGVVPACYSTSR